MSYSLMIANGDLSFNGASFDVVQGSEKLVQDLMCCVLEPMGNDDMHPDYGSLIDGGIDQNGNQQPGVIGSPNDAIAGSYVDTEITRICEAYQQQQQTRYSNDIAIYGTSTITASETLLSIESVTSQAALDHLLVSADLSTGTGDVAVSLPIASSS